MPRSFWSGTISFGLVAIPVRLQPAEQRQDLSFKLLDRKDLSPVGYRRFNKTTEEEVPWERIVRGYEYEDDQFVVLTDQDFERANVEATQSIDILAFVRRDAIDPVFFETPYLVEPAGKASRSYALLREAMVRTERVGIAHVVLRTRAHLAALLVWEGALVLVLMRYAHELRKPQDLDIPTGQPRGAKISPQELSMAERLVEGMVDERWDPSRYHDEYRDDLMRLVRQRIKAGKTHVIDESKATSARKARADVVDLMPLLKKSLASRATAETKARRSSRHRAAERSAPAEERPRRRSA